MRVRLHPWRKGWFLRKSISRSTSLWSYLNANHTISRCFFNLHTPDVCSVVVVVQSPSTNSYLHYSARWLTLDVERNAEGVRELWTQRPHFTIQMVLAAHRPYLCPNIFIRTQIQINDQRSSSCCFDNVAASLCGTKVLLMMRSVGHAAAVLRE